MQQYAAYYLRDRTSYSFADALIYPGLGFGAIISKSKIMTDTMIIAGARVLWNNNIAADLTDACTRCAAPRVAVPRVEGPG